MQYQVGKCKIQANTHLDLIEVLMGVWIVKKGNYIQKYMRDVSKRLSNLEQKTIRSDTPENFIQDLKDYNFIVEIH